MWIWTAIKLFFGKIDPKVWAFLTETIKWVVLVAALCGSAWYIDKTADKRGFDRGVSQTEAKYKAVQDESKTKTIHKERIIHQEVVKATDADLQYILDGWM